MKSQPLSINDNKAFVNRMHNDCSPQQEIRELTVNSIQSIMRLQESSDEPAHGTVVWDVDWDLYEEGESKKLCIIDNGDGIEGDKMELFLNHLSSGIQSRDGSGDTNYGIGAKISALPLNTAGLIYKSWTYNSSLGDCITLGLDADNSYAMIPINGKLRTKQDLDNAPKLIAKASHGTIATMYGNDENQDTVIANGAPGGHKWISQYLNSKFWELPERVTLYAREWSECKPRPSKISGPALDSTMYGGAGDSPNMLRKIEGLGAWVKRHSCASGVVRLENGRTEDGTSVPANAHWFVLKPDAPTSSSSYMPARGHVGCIMKNNSVTEIYEPKRKTVSLMKFGVIQQANRVFIMIEPDHSIPNLTTTAGRDALKVGKLRMPWVDWEAEFASKLPDAISDLYTPDDNSSSIKEKLKKLHSFIENMPTFAKMSKLLKDKKSVLQHVNDPNGTDELGGYNKGGDPNPNPKPTPPNPGPRIDPISPHKVKTRLERAMQAAEVVEEHTKITIEDLEIPKFVWVSEIPNDKLGVLLAEKEADGSFELHDRFAQYMPSNNIVRVNFDFRSFHHFKDIMLKNETSIPKVDIITKQVMESFELTLAETILGVNSLKDCGTWSQEQINQALSPESLTAVTMQRYHAIQVLSRNVNRIIGKRVDNGQSKDESGQLQQTVC
jgi:hypothetical protein